MVLQGFYMGQYVGCVFGILHLTSIKGPPTVPPKRSIPTLYILISYIVILAIWIDFHLRHLKVLKDESPIEKFLSLSLFIGASIFDLYFRLCFWSRGKVVARFLKSLEGDAGKMHLNLGGSSNKKYKNLIMIVQLYQGIGGVITSICVATVISKDSRLLGFIPSAVYPVIFFLFGAIPLTCSFFVSFAFVVSTTIHIKCIFEDFCSYFEEQISLHEEQVLNPMKRDLGEIYSIQNSSKMLGTSDQILSKFEHLKLLCSQYDKICGPLLLGLLVRAVFVLISSANTILLYNGSDDEKKRITLFLNVYHFVTELTQLILLQLGYRMHRRISEKQEDIHRKVILMTNMVPKKQLKEAIGIISDWEWKVSAAGFFEVDRPLLSGVLSSLMTYVTILFQMNVVTDEAKDSMQPVTNSTILQTE